MIDNALILLGSPKRQKGASAGLGNVFGDTLKKKGVKVKTLAVYSTRSKKGIKELITSYEKADLVLLSFPLYWDGIPAGVMGSFLKLYENKDRFGDKKRYLGAVCNCGFPDKGVCSAALRSVELFGKRMGMKYLGGLAMPEGAVIGMGNPGSNPVLMTNAKALRSAADRMSQGKTVTKKQVQDAGKLAMPPAVYLFIGNTSFNMMGLKNGALGKMRDTPHGK